jgi:hypothetical protein
MTRRMDYDLERLNRLRDDLAAERDVAERTALSATDVELAQRAAFLKSACCPASPLQPDCLEPGRTAARTCHPGTRRPEGTSTA